MNATLLTPPDERTVRIAGQPMRDALEEVRRPGGLASATEERQALAPVPLPYPTGGLVLRRGSFGQEVRRLQAALRAGLVCDGIFGPATEAAVAAYQERHRLVWDERGTAGPETQRALGIEVLVGIDVSHCQGDIDWTRVANDPQSIRFAIVKASTPTATAECFAENREGARDAGLVVGCYHFFNPRKSPESQVAVFMKAVGKLLEMELGPALDVEDRKFLQPKKMLERVKETLRLLEAATGRRPILYTSDGIIRGHMAGGTGLEDLADLWCCEYTNDSDPGDVLAPFSEWMIWQHTSKGRCDGVPSKGLDMNYMAGGALRRLLAGKEGAP